MRFGFVCIIGLALGSLLEAPPSRPGRWSVVNISYQQAQPILAVLDGDLPAELKNRSPAELEAAWPGWVTRHDQEIRARLMRGEEDTLVNFLTFGTSYTTQPRLTVVEFTRLPLNPVPSELSPDTSPAATLFLNRVDDLLRGLANPGNNERLLFFAQFMEKQGYHPREAYGVRPDLAERTRLKKYVLANAARVVREQEAFQRELERARQLKDRTEDFAERSKLYRSRGLSYDTSLLPNFAIEESLKAMQVRRLLAPGSVRRVAVIGPGLDFTDKVGGYDFYPQQTIQCFALADALFRLGLARVGQLELTTFDISQRVNDHLRRAKRHAQLGQAYVLQLPRQQQVPWNPATSNFWRQFGNQIGTPVTPIQAPALAGNVETRAVEIRPAIVSMITPVELDIVTQHLDLPPKDGFDLIVATNVFLYYPFFDQLLALANTQSMLRPGGFLLSNDSLPLLDASPMHSVDYLQLFYSDRPEDGDVIVWYQRSPG
jgi:SAM-dependent methyltransferase